MYGNQKLSSTGEIVGYEKFNHNSVTITITLAPQKGLFNEEDYLARFFDHEQNLIKVKHREVKYFVSNLAKGSRVLSKIVENNPKGTFLEIGLLAHNV